MTKKENHPKIIIEKSGFSVYEGPECKYFLDWSDIMEIFAFKRDLLSYDLICLGFRIDEKGTYFEIDEEIEGYEEFCSQLKSHFNEIKTDWFSEVAHPAFKLNLISLWGEPLIEKIWNEE